MKRLFLLANIFAIIALGAYSAPRKKPAVSIDALYEKVEDALYKYDTEAAEEAIDELETALRKAKRGDEARFAQLRNQLSLIDNMTQRVEDIQLIAVRPISADSLMSAENIAIPLSPDAGSWHGADWFATHSELPHDSQSIAHIPATGREVFWSAPSGDSRTIWQAGILLDGSLDNPHPVFAEDAFSGTFDLNAPFLAADGVTLYFSGEIDESSIGSHDIYRAVRDGAGEEFSMPTNLGMPYASTGYDSFFCLDPETGLGYFATDRASDNETFMLYTFIPNETRVNRPDDFEDPTLNLTIAEEIASFLPKTWHENLDLSKLQGPVPEKTAKNANDGKFTLYIPSSHRIYTSLDDFRNIEAREAMVSCLEASDRLEALNGRLENLRQKYAAGDRTVCAEILSAEKEASALRSTLRARRNTAVRLEAQP